jgi:hypothetical protein
MQLCALYLKKILPIIAYESWVSMKNNRVQHAMKLEYLVHENLSHCGCSKGVGKSEKMSILEKVIHHHHYD